MLMWYLRFYSPNNAKSEVVCNRGDTILCHGGFHTDLNQCQIRGYLSSWEMPVDTRGFPRIMPNQRSFVVLRNAGCYTGIPKDNLYLPSVRQLSSNNHQIWLPCGRVCLVKTQPPSVKLWTILICISLFSYQRVGCWERISCRLKHTL